VDAAKNEIHVVSVKIGKDEMKETKNKDEMKYLTSPKAASFTPAALLAFFVAASDGQATERGIKS
jgi:hypothetical protein